MAGLRRYYGLDASQRPGLLGTAASIEPGSGMACGNHIGNATMNAVEETRTGGIGLRFRQRSWPFSLWLPFFLFSAFWPTNSTARIPLPNGLSRQQRSWKASPSPRRWPSQPRPRRSRCRYDSNGASGRKTARAGPCGDARPSGPCAHPGVRPG